MNQQANGDPQRSRTDAKKPVLRQALVDAITRGRDPRKKKGSRTSEYRLVLFMLLTLAVLVLSVLLIPPVFGRIQTGATLDAKEYLTDILEYRRTILAVIITAFGAWVGAGAAYFFGRENLQKATDAILQMREPSARERLLRTPVREIPPKPLDWRPVLTDTLQDVYERLEAHPEYWFIPIFETDEHKSLETIIHEEAFWRYLYSRSEEGKFTKEDREGIKLTEFVKLVRKSEKLKRFADIGVRCTMEQTAGDVYKQMQMGDKDRRMAYVEDETGKPTHFFTTTEVRQLLLDVI